VGKLSLSDQTTAFKVKKDQDRDCMVRSPKGPGTTLGGLGPDHPTFVAHPSHDRRSQFALHAALIAILSLTLLPFVFVLNNSLRTNSEMNHAFLAFQRPSRSFWMATPTPGGPRPYTSTRYSFARVVLGGDRGSVSRVRGAS
jgi:hypothetical protein